VRVVVPYAAGGSTDVIARLVARALPDRLGQPVLVENRTGAGGNVAAEHVARSAPDGYTLLMATNSSHGSSRSLYRSLPFDPVRDHTALSLLAVTPNALVVPAGLPADTTEGFVRLARERGAADRPLRYASAGNGSSAHLAAAYLGVLIGAEMVHVPYRGGAPAVLALAAGEVDFLFIPAGEVLGHVRGGRLKALALSGPRRLTLLPDLPLVSEVLPGHDVPGWVGVAGPAGMPPAVVGRLGAELAGVMEDEEVRATLVRQGVEPTVLGPAEFARFIAAEVPRWARLVEISGARLD
jgi:tripartite-type tricarboxylate transporter receptor subunit TctC